MGKVKLSVVGAMIVAVLVLGPGAMRAMGATGPTVLCKAASAPCPVGSQYPASTQGSGALKAGTELVVSSSTDTVSCTPSPVVLTTSAESGSPLPARVTSFSPNGCVDEYGNACQPSVNGLPFGAALAAGSVAGDGTLTLSSLQLGFDCGLRFDCTFVAPSGGVLASFTGGTPATLQFSDAPLNSSGGGDCPATATLSATYELTGGGGIWLERSS